MYLIILKLGLVKISMVLVTIKYLWWWRWCIISHGQFSLWNSAISTRPFSRLSLSPHLIDSSTWYQWILLRGTSWTHKFSLALGNSGLEKLMHWDNWKPFRIFFFPYQIKKLLKFLFWTKNKLRPHDVKMGMRYTDSLN